MGPFIDPFFKNIPDFDVCGGNFLHAVDFQRGAVKHFLDRPRGGLEYSQRDQLLKLDRLLCLAYHPERARVERGEARRLTQLLIGVWLQHVITEVVWSLVILLLVGLRYAWPSSLLQF